MHRRHHTPSAPIGATRMRWSLLLLLSVAQLMVILDISAVNVALPDLAGDLGISGGDLGWAITSYSLVFGSLLLLGGRLADVFGGRRVFMTGLAVFTLASIGAALAQTGDVQQRRAGVHLHGRERGQPRQAGEAEPERLRRGPAGVRSL